MSSNRGMRWCFTYNVPGHQQKETAFGELAESLSELLDTKIEYAFFGKEQAPSTGQWHAQGYVKFKTLQRFNQVKACSFPSIHWEQAKGNPKQNWEYCTKEDKFPTKIGTIPGFLCQGERQKADWERIIQLSEEGDFQTIKSEYPGQYVSHFRTLKKIREDVELEKELEWLTEGMQHAEWIWGPPGSGKTRLSYMERKAKGESYFDKMPNKWWCGYKHQDVVIIQDIDPTGIQKEGLVNEFKKWCDIYPFMAERKGGGLQIRPKYIVITSNYSIQECFPNGKDREAMERRCKVRWLKDFKEYTEPGGEFIKDHSDSTVGHVETEEPQFIQHQDEDQEEEEVIDLSQTEGLEGLLDDEFDDVFYDN